ncbi:MAG: hypothetical protein HQK91_09590 [Nitrospirae bacterium]|nr:hypothetical protein [Nitrospirota bacterium]
MSSVNCETNSKRYFYILLLFVGLWLLMIFYVMIKNLFIDKPTNTQQLYEYQLDRLKKMNNIETLFIGDCSLGYVIDEERFSELSKTKTANLALNGAFELAGPFNILKKAAKNNKLKNVIIILNLKTLQFPFSYEGYLYSMDSLYDLKDLNSTEKIKALMTFLDLIFSHHNMVLVAQKILKKGHPDFGKPYIFEDGYVKQQNRKTKFNSSLKPLNAIEMENTAFLVKIIQFCKNSNINLIYAHAPTWDRRYEQSTDYIKQINKTLTDTGIKFIPDILVFDNENIGDNENHIVPSSKQLYTEKYYNLLKSNLIY